MKLIYFIIVLLVLSSLNCYAYRGGALFDADTGNAKNGAVIDNYKDGPITLGEDGSFTYNGVTYTGKAGDKWEVKDSTLSKVITQDGSGKDNDGREFDGNVNAEYSSDTSIYNYADQISYTQNNERITLIGVENGKFEKNGDYKIEKASNLKQGSTTIVNGENVEFRNGNFSFTHADSILTDNAISTNVYNFSGNAITFHLDSADQIMSDGISFNDVKNATFTADDEKALLVTEEGILVTITDESFSQTTFEAIAEDGSILVTKDIPAEYTIRFIS